MNRDGCAKVEFEDPEAAEVAADNICHNIWKKFDL